MIRIQEILDKVSAGNPNADLELIQKAYVFAATAHAGQTRLSGEPYLSHPLAVASILAEMGFDEPTIAAGLLHDTVEDTKATIEELDENFGEEVADIVDGVTKISQITFENKEEAQAENIRKMILAMANDMRCRPDGRSRRRQRSRRRRSRPRCPDGPGPWPARP